MASSSSSAMEDTSSSSSSTRAGRTESERLQAVLDSLVHTATIFSSGKGINSEEEPERRLFDAELGRILADDGISVSDKIDFVTELAQTCFGAGWEANPGAIAAGRDGRDDPGKRKRKRCTSSASEQGKRRSKASGKRPADSSSSRIVPCPMFMQECPEDLLLYVFSHLDAPSLCRASQTCRYWKTLTDSFETSLWTTMTRREWGLSDPNPLGLSWKEFFKMHWNIHQGTFRVHQIEESVSSFSPLTNGATEVSSRDETDGAGVHTQLPGTGTGTDAEASNSASDSTSYGAESPPPKRRYVAAWPADPINAYIVALDAETSSLAWVEIETDALCIFVSALLPSGVISKPLVLRGHENPIGLILSNMEGTLVSFDDSSTIIVWNLATMQFERAINANDELGFIFSMNIHKRKIVTGGQNGRVIVWNADTGDSIWSVDVDEKYIHRLSVQNLLNVAVWGDLVAYGIWEGTFWVGDMKEKKEVARFHVSDMKEKNRSVDERTRASFFQFINESSAILGTAAVNSLLANAWSGLEASLGTETATMLNMVELIERGLQTSTGEGGPGSSSSSGGSGGSSSAAGTATSLSRLLQEALSTTSSVSMHVNIGYAEAGQPDGPPSSASPSHMPGGSPDTNANANANANGTVATTFHPWNQPSTDNDDASSTTSISSDEADENDTPVPPANQLPTALAPYGPPLVNYQPPPAPQWATTPPDATLYPMTLALNAHILLTNGPLPNQLAVWDLRAPHSGRNGLYTLASARKPGSEAPHIKFAEISRDGSMVFASTAREHIPVLGQAPPQDPPEAIVRTNELLVWDYRVPAVKAKRRFEKVMVASFLGEEEDEAEERLEGPIEVWVCWDEV
ncbi:uncharacterized protein EV422DRAFT_336781 [Fimicolochytrium jonesii]|uniref:uncharacterized protein n=1 Tax=Fimicolochytrium jonesii TaxID=1396493 RepID=UPI0022FDD487|nr:uncharacterized protein EV422DRAFT_336781 [Fimicolochytrium jonesii]KAI8815945.1 hypothetical protein EV422DRAFT_336781 [Fimicolochytrium jonesii]